MTGSHGARFFSQLKHGSRLSNLYFKIITDKLNTPCVRFNKVDVINRAVTAKQWRKFPDSFICERLDWLNRFQNGEMVFVHGDFNPDNILVDTKRNLYVIDFADSVIAPAEYELAAIICEAFCIEEA